jgi:hypothetical protein
MGGGWKSYSDYLPTNSAIPYIHQYETNETPKLETLAWAMPNGWMWKIPTQERYGCGYVYSDKFTTYDNAVDELIKIMSVGGQIAQDILGALTSQIPLPLLFASEFLGGYSESRAFIGTIEELQKLGIPTGPLPDGTPNLTVLSMFGQLKAAEKEKNENGKVQVAIKPTAVTPAGFTIPLSASGLYF